MWAKREAHGRMNQHLPEYMIEAKNERMVVDVGSPKSQTGPTVRGNESNRPIGPSLTRVLAIDIGLRNLAYCFLAFDCAQCVRRHTGTLSSTTPASRRRQGVVTTVLKPTCEVPWQMVIHVANTLHEEHMQWRTLALGSTTVANFRRISEAQLLQWIAEFFAAHRHLFCEADIVVIEQQRGARLRVLAGALYALAHQARMVGLKTSVPELQTPFCKLAFAHVLPSSSDGRLDGQSSTAARKRRETTTKTPRPTGLHTTGYQARKRIAVQLVTLLKPHLPDTQVRVFESGVKKDDLADSMLHALWRACRLVMSSTHPQGMEANGKKNETP